MRHAVRPCVRPTVSMIESLSAAKTLQIIAHVMRLSLALPLFPPYENP